jgi:GNAT superfamily N-acetyltransferase
MPITFRTYQSPDDYRRISAFLIANHQPENRDGNWLEPTWEYMHGHPYLHAQHLHRIGIWEDQGEIVAITHFESLPGEAFFQFRPGYEFLRADMLDYAKKMLLHPEKDEGGYRLHVFVNDFDQPFTELVQSRGYQHIPEEDRPMAIFNIPHPFPEITVPEGYSLVSLADEPDWGKVNRVMWRGFNHPGEPDTSPEELDSRRKMFDTVTARRDLKIAVKAPHGNFAAFCGMFYQPENWIAYVEPVATDPDYRRMGLGKAAVLEGVRRCAALGATHAYVGSDQPFYLALGFEVIYISQCWRKVISSDK